MATTDLWAYRQHGIIANDLSGLTVEATDGRIGKIDEATNDVGNSFVVVDTGPWIFGKKVMLPAGVIEDVDLDTETVYVGCTKDQIKHAPEFDPTRSNDESYRNDLGGYFGPGGPGSPGPGVLENGRQIALDGSRRAMTPATIR